MRKQIHVDLLGISHLLKGVQYLLFPAAIGVDLLRDLAEAAAEAEARAIEMRVQERPSQGRKENIMRGGS